MKEAVSELEALGIKATGGSVDITDGPALKAWIKAAGEELGGIDILISNAGAMAQGNDPDAWKKNFELDVLGAVNAFDAASPFLTKAAKANGGLRVNTVSPGMVYFEGGIWHMVETNQPEFFKQANSRNPMGRCATPQEIANAAVFLASPLSSYTTGANLIVDGAVSNRVNF